MVSLQTQSTAIGKKDPHNEIISNYVLEMQQLSKLLSLWQRSKWISKVSLPPISLTAPPISSKRFSLDQAIARAAGNQALFTTTTSITPITAAATKNVIIPLKLLPIQGTVLAPIRCYPILSNRKHLCVQSFKGGIINNLIFMFVFFFNFIRPHSQLNGLTLTLATGLKLIMLQKSDTK